MTRERTIGTFAGTPGRPVPPGRRRTGVPWTIMVGIVADHAGADVAAPERFETRG
ncbi:hypothetical protein [Streptomyces sp. NPDC004520]|uniref:hypothetical protein n=1 Tax=unclassified Streptomyces TaxID=2593676 RepID=UPI0036C97285